MQQKGSEVGASALSPGAAKAMSYAFPALSFLFTWWLPSGLQLSFFITGVLSYIQGAAFRWAPFRQFFKIAPLPPRKDPVSASSSLASPYAPRIITAQQKSSSLTYEAPTKPTILSDLKKEVKGTISNVQESAKKTMKAAREYTGQDRKDGKRTKSEIEAAERYEKKRREEELARMEEEDMERRRRREERRRRERNGM